MADPTPRFALPLLAAGQAQKELFHNEAIAALEVLAQPVAETLGDAAPPAAPIAGRSWIVGTSPTGDWAGHPGAVASWGAGGWRFLSPIEGMALWVAAPGLWAQRTGGAWVLGQLRANAVIVGGVQVVAGRQPSIADPAGGATIDGPARAAIAAMLAALRTHGLIAT